MQCAIDETIHNRFCYDQRIDIKVLVYTSSNTESYTWFVPVDLWIIAVFVYNCNASKTNVFLVCFCVPISMCIVISFLSGRFVVVHITARYA